MRTCSVAVAVVFLAGSAVAAERVDAYGVPLPDRAVMRLGTARLRHAGFVTGVAFSPDGKTLASVSHDDRVRIWDVATGGPGVKLQGASFGTHHAVAYSPDGTRVAAVTAVAERAVRMWAVPDGDELWASPHAAATLYAVAFSPDGESVAVLGNDGAVIVRDSATGEVVAELTADLDPSGRVALAYSSDGALLAAATRRSIHVWDLRDGGDPVVIEEAHRDACVTLAFLPGRYDLISSGHHYQSYKDPQGENVIRARSRILQWDAETGMKIRDFLAEGAEEVVGWSAFALSDDGRTMVSVHPDRLLVWDVLSGSVVRTIEGYKGHPAGIRSQSVDLSPDGKTVACHGDGNEVLLWDVGTGRRLFDSPDAHSTSLTATAASADGRFVATGDDDGIVRVWEAATGAVRHRLTFGESAVKRLEFTRDGRWLLAGGHDYDAERGYHGAVRVWEVKTGEDVSTAKFSGRIQSAAFSPDGVLIAAGTMQDFGIGGPVGGSEETDESSLALVEVATGKVAKWLAAPAATIAQVGFSSDGRTVASFDESGLVSVFGVADGEQRFEKMVERLARRDPSAAFAPDLSYVMFAGLSGTIVRMGLDDAGQVAEVPVPDGEAHQVAVSPDGRLLAIACEPVALEGTATIRIVDRRTGAEVLRLTPEDERALSLAFTGDGRRLVSGSDRGTALVWDVSAAYERVGGGSE